MPRAKGGPGQQRGARRRARGGGGAGADGEEAHLGKKPRPPKGRGVHERAGAGRKTHAAQRVHR